MTKRWDWIGRSYEDIIDELARRVETLESEIERITEQVEYLRGDVE